MRETSEYEARLTGRLRSQNRGQNNLHSEETKIIRSHGKHMDPMVAAHAAQQYYDEKTNKLASFYQSNAQNNRKTTRPTLTRRFRLPEVPHAKSSWARHLANVPTLHIDRKNANVPLEDQSRLMRDRFGHAGSGPEQGPSYVWPNFNYYGNPWGMGGQLFTHLRQGGQQDDGYLHPYKNDSNRDKKRVTFAQ